ncbi:hypothetical protein ACAW74_16395 [Fibrella sp. WM1]|uniref:hypothetical protein n=1 Tax=Fibrella musci TaxID=3242485 RepID=UPI003520256A
MKKISLVTGLCTTVLLMAFSCGDSTDNPAATSLKYTYKILDAQGKPSTLFKQGDAVYFQLSIENTTGTDIGLRNFYGEFASSESDAFSVDRKSMTDAGTEKWTRLGKACFPVVALSYGSITIPAKGTYDLKYEWLDPSPICQAANTPLNKGVYRSQFTHTFGGSGGNNSPANSTQTFSTEFTVE